MNIRRIVLFAILCSASFAQTSPATPAPDLRVLLQAAQKAESDWLAAAQDLDSRLTRLLPCDARATLAIQEAASASATRLAAHAQYMQALVSSAAADAGSARRLLETQRQHLSAIPVERSDIAQEQAGVESQILNLTSSLQQRPTLRAALDQLREIQSLVEQRATTAGNQTAAEERVALLLSSLVTSFEKREAALRQEASAFETERAQWNSFYTARADRARRECTITGGGR